MDLCISFILAFSYFPSSPSLRYSYSVSLPSPPSLFPFLHLSLSVSLWLSHAFSLPIPPTGPARGSSPRRPQPFRLPWVLRRRSSGLLGSAASSAGSAKAAGVMARCRREDASTLKLKFLFRVAGVSASWVVALCCCCSFLGYVCVGKSQETELNTGWMLGFSRKERKGTRWKIRW